MADRITYVGLDVHKESIVVAMASGGLRGEVREYSRIANTTTALDRLLRKLGDGGVRLRFSYEDGVIPARRSGFAELDGSCGATVHRRINQTGVDVAPRKWPSLLAFALLGLDPTVMSPAAKLASGREGDPDHRQSPSKRLLATRV